MTFKILTYNNRAGIVNDAMLLQDLIYNNVTKDADVQFTLDAYDDIFPTFKQLIESNAVTSALKGQVVEAVFRKVKY